MYGAGQEGRAFSMNAFSAVTVDIGLGPYLYFLSLVKSGPIWQAVLIMAG